MPAETSRMAVLRAEELQALVLVELRLRAMVRAERLMRR